MEWKYSFDSGEINIKTPKVNNVSEIIRDTIMQPDVIITVSTFPQGLVFKTTQYADHIDMVSNWPIIKNLDGDLQFAEP